MEICVQSVCPHAKHVQRVALAILASISFIIRAILASHAQRTAIHVRAALIVFNVLINSI